MVISKGAATLNSNFYAIFMTVTTLFTFTTSALDIEESLTVGTYRRADQEDLKRNSNFIILF